MSQRDYYEVLGVPRNADENAIKAAFRKKAAEFHPDRHPNVSVEDKRRLEEKFKELGEAYEILSDREKRTRYDQFGHAATAGAAGWSGRSPFEGFGDLSDIFNDMMGGMFGTPSKSSRSRQGADLQAAVELSFEEAAFGKEVQLEIASLQECAACHGSGVRRGTAPSTCGRCGGQGRVRASQGFFSVVTTCPACHGSGEMIRDPCPECHGQGRLRGRRRVKLAVPPGVDNGIQIRKRGEGESGLHGGRPGDLYVTVSVRPHPFFTRDGADILCELPITIVQAALGSEVEIPTLEGKAKLKIAPGTQNGKILRMKGKGVARLEGSGRGDQLVTLFVETPTHLNSKQCELLQKFALLSGDESTPRRKTFLEKLKELF